MRSPRVLPAFVAVAALAALAALPAVAGAAKQDDQAVRKQQEQAARPKAKAKLPEPSGRIGIQVAGAYRVDKRQLAITGRALRITGRIVPYVEGEKVTVRIWRGRTLIKQRTVRPKPSETGRTATYTVRFTPEKSGAVRIFALHARSEAQRRLVADASLAVVAPTAGYGARGPFVSLLQQRLAALGYATSRSGTFDDATARAVLAFRKVNRMDRTTSLDATIVNRLLRGVGGFKVRYPGHGRHVEANLSQQVLALIENGKVLRAYTTSSGTSVTPTVLGNFRFYWKDPGTNEKGMVHSAYFIRGYAIHGYAEVPTYPASHGCLRIPIPDALSVFNWIRIGDQIDVYY